jgi:threonine dehydrogenase-like Zn-dependent dehydrogenase
MEVDLNLLVRQEKSFTGAYGSSAKTWQRVLPVLADFGEELSVLITHMVPLERGVDGFELAKSPDAVKVVITS